MMTIDYYVFCFDRYLSVTVDEAVAAKAESILDNAYDNWHQIDTDECCEEFMLRQLTDAGIPFTTIEQ